MSIARVIKGKRIWIVLALIAIVATALYLAGGKSESEPAPEAPVEWKTYTNEAYDFTVSYPSNWVLAESLDGSLFPAINIYKPGSDAPQTPFDHFFLITNVSIYPEGIPTEGISGESREADLGLHEAVYHSTEYLLSDGTPWATYTVFKTPPASWKDYGFLWSRLFIASSTEQCVRDGVEIDSERCDVLTGDTLVRSGQVDQEDAATVKRILDSFKFTKAPVDTSSEEEKPIVPPTTVAPEPTVPPTTPIQRACRPTGCSGEICSDHPVVSTCAYRLEYACYATATCERQPSGECGWTPTPDLAQCLDTARSLSQEQMIQASSSANE